MMRMKNLIKNITCFSLAIIINSYSFPAISVKADTQNLDTVISNQTIEITTPGVTMTPTPDPTVTLIPDITVTPTPELSQEPTPEPTAVLSPVPSVTPAPVPSKIPDSNIPNTLKNMMQYDYIGNSITGVSKFKLPLNILQMLVKSYGKLHGTGMPYDEYTDAMSYQWTDETDYKNKPCQVRVDIKKSLDYAAYVNTLKKLSRYDGVYLYKIGESTKGRPLYTIEIDMPSNVKKDVYMLTGQVHAREFAGGTFIVKQFADLIQKAQTDTKTMNFLKKHKFVAVPIINVDGREALIKEPYKWTSKGSELWKAFLNGTDGNRNYPGLQWGQVANGNRLKWQIAGNPGYANYPGSYAGSNNETKALMKWLYHYVVVEKAVSYLDLHEQGHIVYAGKGWETASQAKKSYMLRNNFLKLINSGNTVKKYTRIYESSSYGLEGEGSTLTDYAVTLAVGAKFSPAYGFSVFTNGFKEYILMQIKDLDRKIIPVKPANSKFSALTVEIGYGTQYLGNTYKARKLLSKEYQAYHFGKLLENLPKMAGKK